MIAVLRSSTYRIYVAIAISVMLHAVILFLPYLHLPHQKVNLPSLTVRLELLPHPADKQAVIPQPPDPISKPGNGSSIKKTSNTAALLKKMVESATERQFPKHLQLVFTIFKDENFFRAGELNQQLDIDGDRYNLTSIRQTSGMTSRLIQTSHGKIDEHGFLPEHFKEESGGNNKQKLNASFDWQNQQLHFKNGTVTSLPAGTQDILSFMYQLSQLSTHPMLEEFFPLPITDGTHLEQVQIEIGLKETLSTSIGDLRTLHLRKMHSLGEAYFEIWLGMEYRMLPVKYRQVDSSGKVVEEYVISDIRAEEH